MKGSKISILFLEIVFLTSIVS